jgi:tetratricopeptide (TPR) repeat protein
VPIPDRLDDPLGAALAAAESEAASPAARAEMLMEVAMGLQRHPRTPDHLDAAVRLYDRALALAPPEERLLVARITARKATALQAMPEPGTAALERARVAHEDAIRSLRDCGSRVELAEAQMKIGRVLQRLAAAGRARFTDAISAYQNALSVFDRRRYPAEFAILQDNLATAFLATTGDGARIREPLAVPRFEEGLKTVPRIDHPSKYAMLRNDPGNALQ